MDDRILYCSPFFLSAILIFIVALFTFQRLKARGGWYLAFVCLSATVWAVGEGMLYIGLDIKTNMLITKLSYFGIALLPPSALLFGLTVFGYESRIIKTIRLLIFCIAAVIILLVWTNPLHKLFFSAYYTIDTGPFPMLGLKHGLLWWITIFYHYSLIAILSAVLFHQMVTSTGYHRSQAGLILAAVIFVWTINAIYVSGHSPVPNMDISPIAFVMVAASMAWGFFRFRLLDILPVAKAEIFRGLDGAFLVLDDKDRLIDMNPAAESVFRIEMAQVIGQEAFKIFDKLPQLKKGVHEVKSPEIRLMQEGREHVYDFRSSSIGGAKGSKAGRIITLRNITERKRGEAERKKLQEQLNQAHKMEAIGTLAGGIAHDFNNILGIIIGNTELALDDVPEWNPARESLDEIKTAGLRAKEVVRQLLSFSQKTGQQRRPLNIAPLINESMQLLRASIPATIGIHANIADDSGKIKADPTQIQQMIINLCTNAAQAMEQNGGVLEVSLSQIDLEAASSGRYGEVTPGRYVQLTVKDTGEGIDPEIQDKVFDPYFTTREVGKGSGMGLAIVHGIVMNHDGAINFSSQPGKGTTAKVIFPICEETYVEPRADLEDLPTGDEGILFIDDEESIVKMTGQMLARLGYRVETLKSPVEALELFRSRPEDFDLVITDMTMPNMTGDVLASGLMTIRPDIPVILCTGYSKKISDELAAEIGIKAFVYKPIVRTELAKTVRNVLDEESADL